MVRGADGPATLHVGYGTGRFIVVGDFGGDVGGGPVRFPVCEASPPEKTRVPRGFFLLRVLLATADFGRGGKGSGRVGRGWTNSTLGDLGERCFFFVEGFVDTTGVGVEDVDDDADVGGPSSDGSTIMGYGVGKRGISPSSTASIVTGAGAGTLLVRGTGSGYSFDEIFSCIRCSHTALAEGVGNLTW